MRNLEKVVAFSASVDIAISQLPNPNNIRHLSKWVFELCGDQDHIKAANTIIPIYNGGRIANRWQFHTTRLLESCKTLNIKNYEPFLETYKDQSETNNEPVYA